MGNTNKVKDQTWTALQFTRAYTEETYRGGQEKGKKNHKPKPTTTNRPFFQFKWLEGRMQKHSGVSLTTANSRYVSEETEGLDGNPSIRGFWILYQKKKFVPYCACICWTFSTFWTCRVYCKLNIAWSFHSNIHSLFIFSSRHGRGKPVLWRVTGIREFNSQRSHLQLHYPCLVHLQKRLHDFMYSLPSRSTHLCPKKSWC